MSSGAKTQIRPEPHLVVSARRSCTRPVCWRAYTVRAMQLPPGHENDPLSVRGIEGRATMDKIMGAAGLLDCEHVIDYGGGRGSWVWTMPKATVYDPISTELAPGREVAQANGLPTTFTDDLGSIEPGDGMLLIAAQQYMNGKGMHDFLAFAHDHLVPGGRLLATGASPLLVLDWLVHGTRLKYDGLAHQAVWVAHAALGAVRRVGHRDGRSIYCIRPGELIRVAKAHGLRHERTLPRALDAEYWQMVGAERIPRHGYDWLVFVRE